MKQATDEIYGMILSGGGAYGAYEVGVMKALFNGESPATFYTPLNAGVFSGTSVGAFNAAVMTMLPELDLSSTAGQLEKIWINDISDSRERCGNGVYRFRGNPFSYLDLECARTGPTEPFAALAGDTMFFAQDFFRRSTNFFLTPGSLPRRILQMVDLSALISIEPFRDLVGDSLHLEGIYQSDRLLRIAATNWQTGELKIFKNEDMTGERGRHAIMASAAIPGVFPPVEVAGDMYVDGGVVMNTPLKCAIQAGATTLHVVYLDPDIENVPIKKLYNTLDTIDRLFTIAMATKTNEDIDTALWVNEGLQVIERASRGDALSNADMLAFIRVASEIQKRIAAGSPYKKLTIHRYHPHDELGGILGMLDFEQQTILRLIKRGFKDAAQHDCAASHCILPC